METLKKAFRLDKPDPPYKIIACGVAVLLAILGIVLIALGSHAAGVLIILLALIGVCAVFFKDNIRRLIKPTKAEQAKEMLFS